MNSKNRIRRPTLAAACALATFALAAPASAQAPRPFTARDLVMLDRVSDPHISPDGKLVVYDLRSTDYAANKARHAIWLATLDGSAPPRRLAASEGGATQPRWSPDGRTIWFMSGRSGSDQVWRTDASRAAATQVTRLPLDVGTFRVSPDGKQLVVSMAVFPDADSPEATRAVLDARKAGKPSGQVYDKLFVRHWDQYADGTRNHLFAVALGPDGAASGAPVPLMRGFDGDSPTQPFGDDGDFTIIPDGSAVIFSAKVAGRTEAWSTNFDLWRVPMDSSRPPVDLTPDNLAADSGPVVSPDGTKLAYRAQKRPGFESDRFGVWIMNLRTGVKHEVAPQWDRSAEALQWSSNGRALVVTAQDMGQQRLFLLSSINRAGTPLNAESGHAGDFDIRDSTLVYVRDDLRAPANIYSSRDYGGYYENANLVRAKTSLYDPPVSLPGIPLTHHNADRLAGVQFGEPEQFSFAGWNGETVHGYVVKPVGWQPGRKYPVAFLIHGGPQGSFGNLFHYRWNAQTYAGAGFAVVMIDFHGSTGYGQAFTDAISGHWGDRPLEDLQKGWAYVLAKYPYLDGDRACALGGSYGGYMVDWIAGVWNGPWKCLVDHDGVFDSRMMGYSTEELWFSEWENGHATPWEHPENYERFNPIDHVAAWTKPELVIHGAHDYRIPLEQGLGTFGALQRKGVPSELLVFPDENHWVLKPQNSVQWHTTVEAWLKRWTTP